MSAESAILDAIHDRRNKRNDIAELYRDCLYATPEAPNFHMINRAIMGRWSEAGLLYIKERAWKLPAPGAAS